MSTPKPKRPPSIAHRLESLMRHMETEQAVLEQRLGTYERSFKSIRDDVIKLDAQVGYINKTTFPHANEVMDDMALRISNLELKMNNHQSGVGNLLAELTTQVDKLKGSYFKAFIIVLALWFVLCSFKAFAAPAPLVLIQPSPKLDDKATQLVEISGIDASYKHAGVFYAHNDSGDQPRFWAIDLTGKVLAEYKVSGAQARDWEDMTTAPCGRTTCAYFADIGDNNYARKEYQVYEVEEPATLASATVKAKAYSFTYEKGKAHNAEGFAYNPNDGYFYVATKDDNAIYRAPRTLSDKMIFYKVCDLDVSRATNRWITGLDFSAAGEMLLRTYSHYFRFNGPDCSKIIDVQSYGVSEAQGEAVAYLQDGRQGFVSISEGVRPAINVVAASSVPVPPPAEPVICADLRALIKLNQCKI